VSIQHPIGIRRNRPGYEAERREKEALVAFMLALTNAAGVERQLLTVVHISPPP
jgi:hypothetical protein